MRRNKFYVPTFYLHISAGAGAMGGDFGSTLNGASSELPVLAIGGGKYED